MTLVEVLRWRAAHTPRQLAFTFLDDGGAIDYGDLDARARVVAGWLQALGPPGERAILAYPPGLDFICALFGCLYAGWIAVPTSPRFDAIAIDADPRATLPMDMDCPESAYREFRPRPEDIALLQYTSGSTLAPRGVMLSHANLFHNTTQIAKRFEIHPKSQGVIWLPHFHDMGLIGGLLQGVQSGFPIALMAPAAFLRRPVRWLQAISETGGTISGGPNFAYDLCVERVTAAERATLDLSSWEVAFNGAEPVRRATIDRFSETFAACGFRREAFYPCYGLAEATLMVAGGTKSSPPVVSANLVGCGQVIDEQQLAVVDGEIWVRGPSVAAGYWRRPDATAESFHAYLANGEGPFLRTGDLGFVENNELFATGRRKATLILNGQNVQAEDIEQAVERSHDAGWPGGVAAFAIEDRGHERLVVVQEIDRRRAPDVDAIVHAIRLRVAEQHQLPVWGVTFLRPGHLPRTTSGKVRRDACRDALLQQSLSVLHEWRLRP